MLSFGKERLVGFAKRLAMLILVSGLIGCAGSGIKTEGMIEAPQDVVAKKAQSRWDALIKGDLDTAYTYLSPGTRSVMSPELYKAKIRSGMWKKVSVESVACAQDRCDVVIAMVYSYRDMKSIQTTLSEIWLQDNGDWWFVPKK